MALVYPPVVRMVWTTCERCGHESSMCAKVSFRVGRWDSKKFDRSRMTCASCREKHRGHWIVDSRWQGPEPQIEARSGGAAWERWRAENPPLDDVFEDDD